RRGARPRPDGLRRGDGGPTRHRTPLDLPRSAGAARPGGPPAPAHPRRAARALPRAPRGQRGLPRRALPGEGDEASPLRLPPRPARRPRRAPAPPLLRFARRVPGDPRRGRAGSGSVSGRDVPRRRGEAPAPREGAAAPPTPRVLVVGGAGYIGSHMVKRL